MVRMELDRAWFSQERGRSYGPGSVDVPEEVAKKIADAAGVELPKKAGASARTGATRRKKEEG